MLSLLHKEMLAQSHNIIMWQVTRMLTGEGGGGLSSANPRTTGSSRLGHAERHTIPCMFCNMTRIKTQLKGTLDHEVKYSSVETVAEVRAITAAMKECAASTAEPLAHIVNAFL